MTPFYDRDGITIYCGDCLEVMPGLDGPFDAIMADWPYGTTACAWDSIIPLDKLWPECKRVIKERGAIVLTASQPFTSMLVTSNLEWFKWEDVWDKKIGTGFLDANRRPLRRHENVLIFSNGIPTYNPQMTKGKPYTRPPKSDFDGYGDFKLLAGNNKTGERYPTSIIEISNANRNKSGHPTQKPVALFSYLIRTYTNPGDIILDNTMGSGTTLAAAQKEGRQAVGIEISEEYCQIAVERLRQPSFFSLPSFQSTNGKQAKQLELETTL